MNIEQLVKSFENKFENNPDKRIIFWYDEEEIYKEFLPELNFQNVIILNMENEAALEVKERIEYIDTDKKFILYFPDKEPAYEENFLLDIQLYSLVFTADRASMIFNDLKLNQIHLKNHINNRLNFFKSKQRLDKLAQIIVPGDTEKDIDLKMIAVLSKSEQSDIFSILFDIFQDIVRNDINFDLKNDILKNIQKFDLQDSFYEEIQLKFGYKLEKNEEENIIPEKVFLNFIIKLMITGFVESLNTDVPNWANSVILKSENSSTVRSFLSRWRDSSKYYPSYDIFAKWVENELNIRDKILNYTYEELQNVETFEEVEKQIILKISEELIKNNLNNDFSNLKEIIDLRLQKHWATKILNDSIRQTYNNAYNALISVINLKTLKAKYSEGFNFFTFKDLINAYVFELYLFDTYYRNYIKYSKLNSLSALNGMVENLYSKWFINNLSNELNRLITGENLINNWKIDDVKNQYNFYETFIKPIIGNNLNKKVAVIISDALRYECARELSAEIVADKDKFEAETSYMLGVLPSYTALGMAALLPHNNLQYKPECPDDIFVDDMPSKGTINRNNILSNYNGKAVTSEDLLNWKRDEGREEVRNINVLYVYHNTIDNIGENDEKNTFSAVDTAITELKKIVNKISNNLNISTVIITSDHGFLFQISQPNEENRTRLEERPANAFKYNKRYLLGFNLPDNEAVWHGFTKNTANTNCNTEFWIPRSANRFHFVQGARFIHGGTMPQEIIIPVVKVKSRRGNRVQRHEKVNIICSEQVINMRNTIKTFRFIQVDKVDTYKRPRAVKIFIKDEENNEIISNIERLNFDSNSDLIEDRTKEIRLSLLGQDFDMNKDYHLIIVDLDTNAEIFNTIVKINLILQDDFLV